MKEKTPLGVFAEEWAEYLEQHGHGMQDSDRSAGVIRSSNGKARYRWLLRCARDDPLLIRPAVRRALVRQARLARRNAERCYVVVRFSVPEPKVLVLPVSRAIEAEQLCAGMAGIPWND